MSLSKSEMKDCYILHSIIFQENIRLTNIGNLFILDFKLIGCEENIFPYKIWIYEIELKDDNSLLRDNKVYFILNDELEKTFLFAPDVTFINNKLVKVQNYAYCTLYFTKQYELPIIFVVKSGLTVKNELNGIIEKKNYCPYCNEKFDLVCPNCNIDHLELLSIEIKRLKGM